MEKDKKYAHEKFKQFLEEFFFLMGKNENLSKETRKELLNKTEEKVGYTHTDILQSHIDGSSIYKEKVDFLLTYLDLAVESLSHDEVQKVINQAEDNIHMRICDISEIIQKGNVN